MDSKGTLWVENTIQKICTDQLLPKISTSWQKESNDLFLSLWIIAYDGKRVSKLFSRFELAACTQDLVMQSRLTDRIVLLLKFLYPERRRRKR